MNYNLKQLLGKHDPKLLKFRRWFTWPTWCEPFTEELEQFKYLASQEMTQQLAEAIPLEIRETRHREGFQLDAEVYAFQKSELLALMHDCYNLGSTDARVMPNFSNSKEKHVELLHEKIRLTVLLLWYN